MVISVSFLFLLNLILSLLASFFIFSKVLKMFPSSRNTGYFIYFLLLVVIIRFILSFVLSGESVPDTAHSFCDLMIVHILLGGEV